MTRVMICQPSLRRHQVNIDRVRRLRLSAPRARQELGDGVKAAGRRRVFDSLASLVGQQERRQAVLQRE